jgi:predicted kinase
MVDDSKWSKKNEKLIDNLEYSIVDIALREGYNVVVDDTNGSQKRLDEMNDLFSFMEYSDNLEVKVVFIDTPLEECIARDEIREV